jgi:hypothetical protein
MPCGDRLHQEGRDGLRALEHDDLLELRQRVGAGQRAALRSLVGMRHVDDAGHTGLHGPAARVAGRRQAGAGAAMIRAIAREDLVAAGDEARDADGVLIGLGAAVGEEEHVDVAGTDLRQLLSQLRARLGRHERVRVGERRGLLLNRLDDALVAVADVDAHQLAVEVDVALAFGRPEVDALGARHRDRIDVRLRRPFEQRVLLRQRDDLLSGHSCECGRHDASLNTASARTLVHAIISSIEQYSSGWCARSSSPGPYATHCGTPAIRATCL